jgi:hypothetical protein
MSDNGSEGEVEIVDYKKTKDMKEYMKLWRQNNKDKVKSYNKKRDDVKIQCDLCNVEYRQTNKGHHESTLLHKINLAKIKINDELDKLL